jgi:Sulfotransferase family
LQVQDDILNMPGIDLDLIGKVENLNTDLQHVLDHLGASDEVRREATVALNKSRHEAWRAYYTPELSGRIYRAYEADFDRFRYTQAISAAA